MGHNRQGMNEAELRLQEATEGGQMLGESFVIHFKPGVLDTLSPTRAEDELKQIGLLINDVLGSQHCHVQQLTLNPDKSSATLVLAATPEGDVRGGYDTVLDHIGRFSEAAEQPSPKTHPRINPAGRNLGRF